jgi:hypothetical protein
MAAQVPTTGAWDLDAGSWVAQGASPGTKEQKGNARLIRLSLS